jgi:L-fuculose-phosphate aldolase
MSKPVMDDGAARDGLVQVMRRMHATGLNRGTSGNASIRVEGGMLVTPSGVPPDALTADGMVFVAEDGAVATDGLRPSSEYRMHHFILQGRPDAGAVVHCHSRHATILACCGKPILPVHYMVLVARAPAVQVAPYATFGSEELARHVVETMGAGSACLMANHGQVTVGRTWQEALAIAEEVEEQAAVTYGAALIGGARLLTAEELAATVEAFRGYGQKKA